MEIKSKYVKLSIFSCSIFHLISSDISYSWVTQPYGLNTKPAAEALVFDHLVLSR